MLNQLKKAKAKTIELPDVFLSERVDSVQFTALGIWLKKKQKGDDETNFLLQSLYASLLKDIETVLCTDQQEQKEKSMFWSVNFKSIALAVAGAIFFGCEGFDGFFAMLGVFSLPAVVFFSAGIIFSVLSLMVLYAFELADLSKGLGITVRHLPEILDIYNKEVEAIKAIRKKINMTYSWHTSSKMLAENLAVIQLLIFRYEALDEARGKLNKLKDSSTLIVAKHATAAVAGFIFFSGGFFAGQTVALEFSGLFIAAVSPTFWPIILASIVVGLAAFSVYWFIERPDMEHLISRWVGLDQEKIDDLCHDVTVKEQKEKLTVLEQNIKLVAARIERVEVLEVHKHELARKNEELIGLRALNIQPGYPESLQKIDPMPPTLLPFNKPPSSLFWRTASDLANRSFATTPYGFHQPSPQSHLVEPLPPILCLNR
ncbi:hypothetical protein [Legionella maioricensis]|uniref:Coiled-coil protein n=1 Tax=Legionella maioricensis TaxID=2896528 RepID=A0A9X2IBS2_9GAMM|nr:hypothetical protein [Legionella maioricensis]MCL9685144.1 hypothetical protein [Legionella maioricensis]MCL9688343.1 hypothetical protein [Legionella maioricensis]